MTEFFQPCEDTRKVLRLYGKRFAALQDVLKKHDRRWLDPDNAEVSIAQVKLHGQSAYEILRVLLPLKADRGGRPPALYKPGRLKRAALMEWSRSTKPEKPNTRQRRQLREFRDATLLKAQTLGPPADLAVTVEREAAKLPAGNLEGTAKRQKAAAIYLDRTKTNHANKAHVEIAFAILHVGGRLEVPPVPEGDGRIAENYKSPAGSARAYVSDVLAVLYPPGRNRTSSPMPGVRNTTCWPAAFREAAAQLRAIRAETIPEYIRGTADG